MADLVSPELEARLQANATQPMEPTGEDAPRSTRRQKAMAKINAAVLARQEQAQQETPAPPPPPEIASPLDTRRTPAPAQKPKLTPEQEQILAAQERLLGEEEAKRLRQEQEDLNNRHALVKAGQRAWRNAKGIVHGADLSIGSIPSPGGIQFPLILLLLFFFILIQVNGFSRVGHLWRVIINAERIGTIDLTQSGPGPGTTDTGIPVTSRQDGPVQQTGQGGEMPQVASYPMLPANGVYAVNGMY